MAKRRLHIPKFSSLQEESDFWDNVDLGEYWDEFEPVDEPIIDARPPKKPISLRLDPHVIDETKRIAGRYGLGYQSLLRVFILEGLARFRRREAGKATPAGRRRRSA